MQNFHQIIVDNIPLAVFVKDAANGFKYLSWNRVASEWWQMPIDSVVGKNDYDVFTKNSADFFRGKDIETMAGRVGVYIPQEKIESPRTEARWLRTWKYPVYRPDGSPLYLIGVSQDITEIVLAQEEADAQAHQLEVMRERLNQAARFAAIGELAGGVAHEINTPLGVILLAADQLKVSMGDNSSAQKQINLITETAERIARITQTMKALSRADNSTPHQATQLSAILEDVLSISRYKLRDTNVKVFIDASAHDLRIVCNQMQLSQVFINLINNSCEAIANLRDRWIQISVEAGSDVCRILFCDSGVGVCSEHAEKLFSSGFTSKSNEGGSGLGLTICKNIMEAHGGFITLDRAAPNTTFVLALPREKIMSGGS